jgi:hypothetical protein
MLICLSKVKTNIMAIKEAYQTPVTTPEEAQRTAPITGQQYDERYRDPTHEHVDLNLGDVPREARWSTDGDAIARREEYTGYFNQRGQWRALKSGKTEEKARTERGLPIAEDK